jgi:hypothetical protein
MFIYFLRNDEQLLIESPTTRRVVNGPGTVIINSLLNRVQRRKAKLLDNRHYLLIINRLTGEKRMLRGPTLAFLGADDEIGKEFKALTLREDEYLEVKNRVTGAIRIERGPQLFFLGVDEEASDTPIRALTLKENEYLHVKNRLTGVQRVERGPQLFFPGVNDDVTAELGAIPLRRDQYMRILNNETGVIRIVRGETSVYLEPNEIALAAASHEGRHNIHQAVKIDEKTAVLLRDISTGQIALNTEQGVFFPTPYQEIVEVRTRIALEDSQIIVIKDRTGKYRIRRGTDPERSFFLAPYEEIVPFLWSTGIHKDKRALKLDALDLRPKFMWYEFEARTQDNVELTLGITFFWQIVNVEGMLATTDDVTGDICSHARSSIIQAVSQVTLERFLADFNNIVRRVVVESRDPFYTERGVTLNAVEVRSIACKDPKTQDILNEIIQETTNRLNRLQKQESENEVRLRQMAGDTEVEQARARLLELQRENELNQATATGDAEARRLAAYLNGLGDMISIENKIAIFNLLRKGEVLDTISRGSAHVYFTPADVNLSIESREGY